MGNTNDTKAEQERKAQEIIDGLRQANKIPPAGEPAPTLQILAGIIDVLANVIIEAASAGDPIAVRFLPVAEAEKKKVAKYL